MLGSSCYDACPSRLTLLSVLISNDELEFKTKVLQPWVDHASTRGSGRGGVGAGRAMSYEIDLEAMGLDMMIMKIALNLVVGCDWGGCSGGGCDGSGGGACFGSRNVFTLFWLL